MSWTVDSEILTRRALITIPAAKVDATLTNKDMFYDLSLLDVGWWGDAKNGGGDVRITDSNGTTRLALDAVTCNTATSEGEIHFKYPSASSSVDNDFYVYCGNAALSQPARGTTYGSDNVYDANQQAKYHLEALNESTGNDFTLSVQSGAPASGAGKLGGSADGAYSFNRATPDVLKKTSETELTISGDWTTELWFKTGGLLSGNNYMISKGTGVVANYYTLFITHDIYGGGYSVTDTNYINAIFAASGMDDSNWHFVQVTCIGTTVELWVDGVSRDTATDNTVSVTSASDLLIGGTTGASSYSGSIDEVGVSDIGRSDAWLAFNWLAQGDPGNTYNTSASESSPLGSGVNALFLGAGF